MSIWTGRPVERMSNVARRANDDAGARQGPRPPTKGGASDIGPLPLPTRSVARSANPRREKAEQPDEALLCRRGIQRRGPHHRVALHLCGSDTQTDAQAHKPGTPFPRQDRTPFSHRCLLTARGRIQTAALRRSLRHQRPLFAHQLECQAQRSLRSVSRTGQVRLDFAAQQGSPGEGMPPVFENVKNDILPSKRRTPGNHHSRAEVRSSAADRPTRVLSHCLHESFPKR